MYAKTEFIDKESKGREIINASQHGFMENRSQQTNLISFFVKYVSFLSLRA